VGYLDTVKRDIVLAGNPPGYAVDRFLVMKVLGAGSALVWIALFYGILGMRGLVPLVLVIALGAVCFLAPDTALRRRITARQEEIERALPDMLDLLVISVEAGLGFEQALERTASAMPGPLADEARRMLQEIRMGSSRADALRALEARTEVDDVRSFTMAMLQADNFGISIAKILKGQADETRLRRRQRAQERAQKMPVKMLFPLVFCVFPAIFVVLLLPGLLTILDSLA
jgi:tight adherence protein C